MSHQELPQDRTLAGPLRHRPVRRSPAARRTRRHLPLPESLGSASSVWLPSAIGAASRWLAVCSARAYWISKVAALVHLGSHGPAGGHGRSPQSAFPSGSTVLIQNPPISAALRTFSPTSFITQRDGSCRRNPAHGWLTHLGGRLRMPVHSWEPSGEPSSADIRPHRTYWSVRFISLTRYPDTTRHFDRH